MVSLCFILMKFGWGGYCLVFDEYNICKIIINYDVGWLFVVFNNNICVLLISVY